jgi:hypothetical protein
MGEKIHRTVNKVNLCAEFWSVLLETGTKERKPIKLRLEGRKYVRIDRRGKEIEEKEGIREGRKKDEEKKPPWLWSVALTTQHPLSAKVGTTSPTGGGRSVGIKKKKE